MSDAPPLSEAVARGWELCTLDPAAARDCGQALTRAGGADAAQGWLITAWVEARQGDQAAAQAALHEAGQLLVLGPDGTGLALCDEIQALALHRSGRHTEAAGLQAGIARRDGLQPGPMQRYIAHSARAATCKALGQADAALRHFYAARDAADETGWAGPRITAADALGGYHHTLFNLEDARTLCEQALLAARQAGARPVVGSAASHLVRIYHAAGDFERAQTMASFMERNAAELMPDAAQRHVGSLALACLGSGEIEAALRHLEAAEGAPGATSTGDEEGAVLRAWVGARCRLLRGNAAAARTLAEAALDRLDGARLGDDPYDTLQLHLVLADACEAAGDVAAALRCMRQVHELHEQLVGRSARARYIALEIAHQLGNARRERDCAVDSHRSAEDDRRRLEDLNAALQARIAETDMLQAQLREQALHDPLTGLHNRRYLFETAPAMLELARRNGRPLCVVLLDLDHFKLINDTYGHQAGDLVLKQFSALLQQSLRRSDVITRHGGEEFVAVMPEIDGEGAQNMLDRLLEAFQLQRNTIGRRRLPSVSFSAGIALFPRHGSTLEQLLSRADRALYAAKHHGRARVEVAPRTGFGTLT
ncbi:putative Diguanylate cyclase [Rubrivivax sp. A210]|uniref:GGDEF domain-containing protein n=1 Tax=Rubrivivax sp. A210 TaxID=2772301 RepID=UPI001919F1E0|nr:GGDEF domain-containing protein [Rubrivivax sp. A210]CAD5373706.1 putative Diguanylate cyclase [Rubrivivax sp. A210]